MCQLCDNFVKVYYFAMIYRLYNIIYRLFRVSLYMILGEFIGNLLIDYFRTINRLHTFQ